jgi:two-component system nitrogen regulation response regulator GlnG
MLSEYAWPGNVRELQSAVKYAVVHARGNVLTPECFPESCRSSMERASSPPVTSECRESGGLKAYPAGTVDIRRRLVQLLDERNPDVYHTIQSEVDRYLLTEALRLSRGNQVEASRLLGISRTTLRAKLDLLGLSVEKQVQTNPGHDDRSLNSPK